MEFIREFFSVYVMYCQELWLTLAVGFFISGVFFKFIPTHLVEEHLGEKGLKPILLASIIGTMLPVCCIGSLPIALTLSRKGATLGSVLAFMVTTPATSISALIVCWKLLGLPFTIFIFLAVILMGLVMGVITNSLKISKAESIQKEKENCCEESSDLSRNEILDLWKSIVDVLRYAFVRLPKEIGLEILIGIALASFITVFEPIQYLIHEYFTGVAGYVFILVIGLVTYVCSTASVPMADAFIQSGMSYGQALCYLLVGPITSYGTILVIKKDFGIRALMIYLGVICVLSVLYGLCYDYFLH